MAQRFRARRRRGHQGERVCRPAAEPCERDDPTPHRRDQKAQYSPRQVGAPIAASAQANLPRISCTRIKELPVRLIRGKPCPRPRHVGQDFARGVLGINWQHRPCGQLAGIRARQPHLMLRSRVLARECPKNQARLKQSRMPNSSVR